MYARLIPALALALASVVQAQEIIEVPESEARIARPDDLFSLPPGQWHLSRSFSQGRAPCEPTQCEAGFTSGDLVVSVEHAGNFVLIIAGFRGCDRVAFREVEVSPKAGSPTFGRISNHMKRVVKGLKKSCGITPPEVPKLEVAQLFPKPPEQG